MKVSLIISVYTNTKALATVLTALEFQRYQDFEVVISEDGASTAMAAFVASWNWKQPYLHVTQPDVGWRKNQALNNAIRACSGDYLIFIDGDCVLHHDFIRQHVLNASVKSIGAGKRLKLGPQYSLRLTENASNLPEFEGKINSEWRKVKADGATFMEEGFYINPNGILGFIPRLRRMSWLKGCNMSCFRSALEEINGFDEDYILPAIGEDIDLTWRFKGLGYTLFSLRNRAVQYHLYHKENWTDQQVNQEIMAGKQSRKEFVCKNGLIKNT